MVPRCIYNVLLQVLMKWYRAQGYISLPDVKQTLGSVLRSQDRTDLAETVEKHPEVNGKRSFVYIVMTCMTLIASSFHQTNKSLGFGNNYLLR